jgi:tetratricopeptide (TPR) repeat protein
MNKAILQILPLLFCLHLGAQNTNTSQDSLLILSYDTLFTKINSTVDYEERIKFARVFLLKSQIAKDTSNIITGFEILGAITTGEESIKHIDSVVKLTKTDPNKFNPANAYLQKGNKYYKSLDYKNSLESYLLSHESATQNFNKNLFYQSLQGIALIKNRIGDYESALKIHKQNLLYFKNDSLNKGKEDYINTLFSIF